MTEHFWTWAPIALGLFYWALGEFAFRSASRVNADTRKLAGEACNTIDAHQVHFDRYSKHLQRGVTLINLGAYREAAEHFRKEPA